MGKHRSPDGRRARTSEPSTLSRHRAAHRPAPDGPSLRTTVLATSAAIGAVATGTFTALAPSSADGVASSASADEAPVTALLAAYAAPATASPSSTDTASTDTASLAPALAGRAALLPVVHYAEHSEGVTATDRHLARLDKAATIAAKLAEQHAREAERARLRETVARGGLDGWIAQALQIADLPQSYAPGVKKIIMAESGGNPRAVNNWDSNARRGTPSQGLMQTIPSTFRHYVHPDVADRPITDPVANITAGVRYMIDNYGERTLMAGGRTNSRGGYIGY